MREIEIMYHRRTNTYWTNSEDWKDRYKEEGLWYGSLQMVTDDVTVVERLMGFRGFQKTYGVEELILRGGKR